MALSRGKKFELTERDKQVISQFGSLLVSYSAGKDSTACLLWALWTGMPTRVIMADTGNEPPDTPEYIKYIERALDIKVEVYAREDHSFLNIVRRRGRWPMRAKCLVSRTTKVDDFKWYLTSTNTPLDALIILGQRRAESRRRKSLPDFSPVLRSGRAAYRPILDWSIEDVYACLSKHKIKAHPAYGKGRRRVGCVWCVNNSKADIILDNELYPARCEQLRQLRREIGLPSIAAETTQPGLFADLPICQFEAVHCE